MKNKPKKISIALDPEILKKLDDGKFNKSKLIDSLLSEHFKNKIRTNTNFSEKSWYLLYINITIMGRKQKSIEDKKKKLSISISEENYQLLNQENKSKLINWLLVEYFTKFNSNGK